MLRGKIDKAAFDALSADLQAEYIEKDGGYFLDLESVNDDQVGELRRAKERAVANEAEALKRAKAAESRLAEIDNNDARKTGDIDKLEKSWREKMDLVQKTAAEEIAAKDRFISTTLVDSVATSMAAKISTAPNLILPHIKARLQADLDGETPATRYLDSQSNPTTAESLEKEFIDNKDYASIIIASKAKGGGAPDKGQQRPGGAGHQSDGKPVSLASLSPQELAAHLAAKKESSETID